jgi:hypothetical protein
MKGIALFFFLVFYAIVMTAIISPATRLFGMSENNGFSFLLTFIFSLIGVGLAMTVLQIKRLSQPIQRNLKIGLFTLYPLFLLFTYIVFGLDVFFTLCLVLLKLIFVLFVCMLPLIFTYGFLKKTKVAVLAPSVGIIFLFFLTLLLPNSENRLLITPDEPWSFILLFIGYLSFFELAMSSLFFSTIVDKIAPQKKGNDFILERFSMVLNSYSLHLVLAITICLLFTGGVVLLKEMFRSEQPSSFMGINLGSLSGVSLFVIVTIICVLLFWLFSPLKKTKKQMSPVKGKESH